MTEHLARERCISQQCARGYREFSHPGRWIQNSATEDCGDDHRPCGCCSGHGRAGSAVLASLPLRLPSYMNHLNFRSHMTSGSFGCRGRSRPAVPCARARSKHRSHKSSINESRSVQGRPAAASGLGKSCHQCISWAASGADDTSLLLRAIQLAASHRSGHPTIRFKGRQLDARTIPLTPRLSCLMRNSKQFLGLGSTTCSHCNTTIPACQIRVNPDLRRLFAA
jgi:hypothetical protein